MKPKISFKNNHIRGLCEIMAKCDDPAKTYRFPEIGSTQGGSAFAVLVSMGMLARTRPPGEHFSEYRVTEKGLKMSRNVHLLGV